MTPELRDLAGKLLDHCRAHNLTLAAAESCTGGLVMATLTDVPGSSAVVDRGYVTYSNAAKTDLLAVPPDLLERHGAVSEETARAMAAGALRRSGADLAVAITGIAGPDGGSPEKPVGLVHIAAARRDGDTTHVRCDFGGIGRDGVRLRSVEQALRLVDSLI